MIAQRPEAILAERGACCALSALTREDQVVLLVQMLARRIAAQPAADRALVVACTAELLRQDLARLPFLPGAVGLSGGFRL